MALCASVIIDDIVNKIDKLYDYAVPGSIEKNLKAGMRVVVPFSKSNIKKKALVVELHDFVDISRLKYIDKIIDNFPDYPHEYDNKEFVKAIDKMISEIEV